MEKNTKIRTFFYKERKRSQRLFRSFIKNRKEHKDRNFLLKRTDAQPCIFFPGTAPHFMKKTSTLANFAPLPMFVLFLSKICLLFL